MGKFKPKVKKPKIAAPAKVVEEEDTAGDLVRAAEKRRKGRRGTILSAIDEEEAQLAPVSRPGAGGAASRAARVLLG